MATQDSDPEARVEIFDFPGLVREVADHDVPIGAGVNQVNCTSENIGVLTSRAGLRLVSFEG